MNVDNILVWASWIIAILALILFIPKNKRPEAQVAFLFKQFITWPIGLLVVEFDLIRYPVRLFPYATHTNFSFEFFIYPAICAVFIANYPEGKTRFRQLLHYALYCSAITVIEVLAERYTNTIEYIHWAWYITWVSLFITLYLARKYTVWFFHTYKKQMKQ